MVRRDYIKERNPSRKGVETIELELKRREYQTVPRLKRIINEHCILGPA